MFWQYKKNGKGPTVLIRAYMGAQRKLFDTHLSFSSAKKERLIAFVDLYRALGNGWTEDESKDKIKNQS